MSIEGAGSGSSRSVGLPVELHEDVVPDLHVAVAAALESAAGAAGGFLGARPVRAPEVVDLRAPPAGAGVAHLPEVVGHAQLADAIGGQEPAPDVERLVVARHAAFAPEDGRVEPVDRQPPLVGEQRPGHRDRVVLEVVAEREVAEHLEERVVAARGADVVEVVVLAAHPHALLRGGGALVVAPLAAEEQVLELVHPGVGEEQRRVVGRHQRGRGHHPVAVAGEEVEEALAESRAPSWN